MLVFDPDNNPETRAAVEKIAKVGEFILIALAILIAIGIPIEIWRATHDSSKTQVPRSAPHTFKIR